MAKETLHEKLMKMAHKTIHIDNAVNREGYLIRCYSTETSIPLESVQVDCNFVDNHYILTESGRGFPARFWSDSFGVAHNFKQVEKRLYSKALNIAGEMSKKYGVPIKHGTGLKNPDLT